MKYLSLCSGIEAATSAWHGFGWEAIAFSEIDPFCCDYLAHHYPNVPNLGSMNEWREWPIDLIGQADMLVAGTPCQSFSIAGLRAGLNDDRGNLTLIFVEIANAVDNFRRDNGLEPLRILWENVPGVYSDSTNGFGSLLAGLCGSDAAIEPPRGRSWTNAGVVSGPKRTAAWRTLDAQYFGVAQRRRRCFVYAVGGSGNWNAPDALLPVTEGMRRDTAPRRTPGQEVAGTLGGGAQDRGWQNDLDTSGAYIPMLASTLTARMHKGVNTTLDEGQTIVCATGEIAHALTANYDAGEDGTGRGTPVVFTQNQRDEVRMMDIPGALSAQHGAKQQFYVFHNRQDPDVSENLALPIGAKDNGLGVYAPEVAVTLTSGGKRPGGRRKEDDENLAVYSIMPMNSGKDYKARKADISQPLVAAGHSNGNQGGDVVVNTMSVRRLTPRECERLQGFPDDATLIPRANGKPAADGPRYRALGNSMAVPVMRWLGKRIAGIEA